MQPALDRQMDYQAGPLKIWDTGLVILTGDRALYSNTHKLFA
jgi:hypothetical protein